MPVTPLPPLQRRIAYLVQAGKDLYTIADALSLSPRQVRRHIEVMRDKLRYPGPARARIVQWVLEQRAE